MADDSTALRGNAVPLRDDSMGVMLEHKPRKIQQLNDREFRCSVNPDWLEKLEMAQQGEPTVHSFSLGVFPVVVQNPAIIIQPASDIEDANGGLE
jgi:hypothetical protein